jgi:hypothetical protein
MLLPAHNTARLQLIMYSLIDLAARTVVRRNNECAARRLGILSRNGRNTFIVSPYLMHTALLLKTFDGGSHLAACQLLNDLLQLWVALQNNVIQRRRPHPRFLQLCERTAHFDGLMLATIPYQQHPIMPMETFDELVHLARGCKRRLVEHIQALFSFVWLHPFSKVMLESRSLHASLCKLVL